MKETEQETNANINGQQHVNYVEGDAWSGLRKREYFAGLAMQGMLASRDWSSEPFTVDENGTAYWTAKHAIDVADELLKQLEKTK